MAQRIQFRRGTAATWTSANPTLATGEVGFEIDTNRIKFGDGSTAWVSLPYIQADAAYTQSFTAVSTVTVNHNLGKHPAVTIIDSSNDECIGDVHHNSSNQLTLTFSASFTGTVYCN